MKLLYCIKCQDLVRLFHETRTCECGATGGKYIGDTVAEVFGDGVPFAISNSEFDKALRGRTDNWPGITFEGWIIPRDTKNIRKIDVPRT